MTQRPVPDLDGKPQKRDVTQVLLERRGLLVDGSSTSLGLAATGRCHPSGFSPHRYIPKLLPIGAVAYMKEQAKRLDGKGIRSLGYGLEPRTVQRL
jgi:hypothetical protein